MDFKLCETHAFWVYFQSMSIVRHPCWPFTKVMGHSVGWKLKKLSRRLKRVKEDPDPRVEDTAAKFATTHSARGPSLDIKWAERRELAGEGSMLRKEWPWYMEGGLLRRLEGFLGYLPWSTSGSMSLEECSCWMDTSFYGNFPLFSGSFPQVLVD